MFRTIIASSALVAAASALSADSIANGKAIVINKCSYPVYLQNTPATISGESKISKVLQPEDTYEQNWTPLNNGNDGWSIKLAKDDSFVPVLQYEYTWQPILHPDTLWYDLSEVDGNPWDGDYMISAEGANCSPRQAAYRFATDDAYGMQDCPPDSHITVTLCSGEAQADELVNSVASKVGVDAPAASVPSKDGTPTTFATVVTPAAQAGGNVATQFHTEIVTQYVTAFNKRNAEPIVTRRHEHGHHARRNHA